MKALDKSEKSDRDVDLFEALCDLHREIRGPMS